MRSNPRASERTAACGKIPTGAPVTAQESVWTYGGVHREVRLNYGGITKLYSSVAFLMLRAFVLGGIKNERKNFKAA